MRDWYGWSVSGVEISAHAVEIARSQFDLDVTEGTIEDGAFQTATFDVVTLWDVLEHLEHPKDTLKEIRRILKPDGLLVFRIPNESSWDARLFGKYWAGYDPPRHYYVFNEITITNLLLQVGFSITSANSNIGSYLNFVKSVQFWMTGKSISVKWRKPLIGVLSSLPCRLVFSPMTWLKNQNNRGPALVISAVSTSPHG
jgi:SAM-dependent methyltransferase